MGWVTKQWDASVVLPAKEFYGINAPGYQGNHAVPLWRDTHPLGDYAGMMSAWRLASGLGYNGGTGNPGDYALQYGWRVEVVQEAADHTWATVKISFAPYSARVPLLFKNAPR